MGLKFLKYNRRFWSSTLVYQAYRDARAEDKSNRLKKLMKQQEAAATLLEGEDQGASDLEEEEEEE